MKSISRFTLLFLSFGCLLKAQEIKTEFNKETQDSIIEIIVEKYKKAEL